MNQKLIVEVKYVVEGSNKMLYTLNLSEDRRLELYVHIYCLSPTEHVSSKYTPLFELNMNDLFIGEKETLAQV